MRWKVAQPIAVQTGIVTTQAATIRPATPQRTADARRVAPTPMIAEEITFCVPLPSAFRFFDLRQGLSPLSLQNSVTLTNSVGSPTSFTLVWGAPANYIFAVYYTDSIAPPFWRPYPDYITSTDGTFIFVDDGSKTGGFNPSRFYRIVQVYP